MELRSSKFIICAVGIFVTYFYFGIIQERITKGNYGSEKFTCIQALVFFQCAVNYIYGNIMQHFFLKHGEDTTRTIYYMSSALTYLLAMVCSNMALQWVSYPTQVIGKSAKPIPVMILGVLLGRKTYSLKKYCFVVLVVIGVALFIYKDDKNRASDASAGFGEILLLLSLTMDGITGAVQERMRSESKTKPGHMMCKMNMWSVIFLGSCILLTGELKQFFYFVERHPQVLWELLSFSLASALGQFFIYLVVSEYGPLPCSIITTTRKFFTVLASVVIYGNSLLVRQWFAATLVFTGLLLDSIYSKTSKNK